MAKRKRSRASELTLLDLPVDALSLVARLLEPFDRARFRLISHKARQAVRAVHERLYWYCYRLAYPCLEPECTSGPSCHVNNLPLYEPRAPLRPAIIMWNRYPYVMRVLPVRLTMLPGDTAYGIYCDGGHWVGSSVTLHEDDLYHEGDYCPRDLFRRLLLDEGPPQWRHRTLKHLPCEEIHTSV